MNATLAVFTPFSAKRMIIVTCQRPLKEISLITITSNGDSISIPFDFAKIQQKILMAK